MVKSDYVFTFSISLLGYSNDKDTQYLLMSVVGFMLLFFCLTAPLGVFICFSSICLFCNSIHLLGVISSQQHQHKHRPSLPLTFLLGRYLGGQTPFSVVHSAINVSFNMKASMGNDGIAQLLFPTHCRYGQCPRQTP